MVLVQCYGQGATVAYPIKPGDGCMIFFSEQALDQFLYERDTKTDLHFDLTNAVALVGLFAKANPIMQEACSQNAIIVDVKGTRITVKSGKVQIDAAEVIINGNTTVNGNFSTRGGIVNLN